MYTENQLDRAYATYLTNLHRIKLEQNIDIFIPDREEFRKKSFFGKRPGFNES